MVLQNGSLADVASAGKSKPNNLPVEFPAAFYAVRGRNGTADSLVVKSFVCDPEGAATVAHGPPFKMSLDEFPSGSQRTWTEMA